MACTTGAFGNAQVGFRARARDTRGEGNKNPKLKTPKPLEHPQKRLLCRLIKTGTSSGEAIQA